jgi:hypothetical protein
MKKLYGKSSSQKPGHFNKFMKLARTEIFALKKRTFSGKRECMVALVFGGTWGYTSAHS